MNVLQYLMNLRPAIPTSNERPPEPSSNSELRRWCRDGAVLINGERVSAEEPMDFPVFSLVFFPKAKRKTTVV